MGPRRKRVHAALQRGKPGAHAIHRKTGVIEF
jgi:hypothetical protein